MSYEHDLKPCPWCGGEADAPDGPYGRPVWVYEARCTVCHALGAQADTKADVVSAWNRRPAEDALRARAEAAEQRAEAWRWFAQEVASDMHPIGADPLGDITTDFLPVLLDITRRAAQQQGADCARAEAALAQARADQAEARGFLAECHKQLDELEGILSDTLAARARAEAEAERLRRAIAETLRLADIYAGVAAHNAEAEPETAGEAWRSAGAATVRELRRALGGAA